MSLASRITEGVLVPNESLREEGAEVRSEDLPAALFLRCASACTGSAEIFRALAH